MTEATFETKLQGSGSSVGYIEIPKKVMAIFGGRKRVKVRATINGYTYRTTIFSMRGCLGIPVRREVRENAEVELGHKVEVKIQEDVAQRKVSVPADLLKVLKASKKSHDRFKSLSYTHQKEYVQSVTEAKKPETRAARIKKIKQSLIGN